MTNQQVLDTEQELLRLRAEYDNFVYHTTHDLAALFRHINVFATEVSDQLTKQDDIFLKEHVDIHKFAELISTTSKNGSTIIRALQDYDELDKTPLNLATIDLNSLVTDAISNLNSVEGLAEVKIKYKNLPTIVSDRKLLLKVFQEIFKNSIMYRTQSRLAMSRSVLFLTKITGCLNLQIMVWELNLELKRESLIFSLAQTIPISIEA